MSNKENNKRKRRIITILAIIIIIILLLLKCCSKKKDNGGVDNSSNNSTPSSEVIKDDNSKKEDDKKEESKQDEPIVVIEEKPVDGYSYYVNFLDLDGSVLQRTVYKIGELPKYKGNTPSYNGYTFLGWDKTISKVSGTQTYKALYNTNTHTCSHYTIQSDGSWLCSVCHKLLKDTDDAYFTVLNNDQPTEIIKLTATNVSLTKGVEKIDTTITYSNSGITSQNLVIRTESFDDDLTIDAPNDTVSHYGKSGTVNVIEVANTSYHEHGTVPFLEVAKGRVALEENSNVYNLHFNAKDISSFDDIIVAKDSKAMQPTYSRSAVDIGSSGVLVVELQHDTKNNSQTEKDFIWLYKQGIYEQIQVSETKDGIKSFVVSISGTTYTSTRSDETKEAAMDIANNYSGKSARCYSLSEDNFENKRDLKSSFSGNVNETGLSSSDKSQVINNVKSAEDKELAIYGPNGSFSGYMTLGAFRDDVNNNNNNNCYANHIVKVLKDLDYTGEDWVPIGYRIYGGAFKEFDGIFDGNNKTIKVKNSEITCCDYFGFFGIVYNNDMNNFYRIYDLNLDVDFHASSTKMPYLVLGGLVGETYAYVGIKNVNITGDIVSNRIATGIVGNCMNNGDELGTVIIENCRVEADISAFSVFDSDNWLAVSGIVGQNNARKELLIRNCKYTGSLSTDFTGHTSEASSYIGYVMAKGANDGSPDGLDITNISNFEVGNGSSIIGYQNITVHDYPFEGKNTNDNSYTYSGSPNVNKELVGGYFHVCTIDGVTENTNYQNEYPHGGSE